MNISKQEKKLHDTIKVFDEPWISAENLFERCDIPINDIEIIHNNLYEKELLDKTKADVYKKNQGEGTVT
ncbi:hypothetical protein KAU33_06500 [Candidatus Dependentiae bacterium]|nr:hypothetical protein [Candidatus Dependentiae bacterium]